jgi:DNA-binding MarR family transcriptional regulator
MARHHRLQDWRHDNTGRLLFDSTRKFQEYVRKLVNQNGYPDIRIAHLAVTRHIDLAGTRIADVAQRAGVTKQSMGEMIDQLETMGFVTRTSDPADKRAKIILFTPDGRRLLDVIRDAVLAGEEDIRAQVGDDGLHALRDALFSYCRTEAGDAADAAIEARRRQRRRA